jgi:GR25 family glycosyltransferase involved in LPS biosynthesis
MLTSIKKVVLNLASRPDRRLEMEKQLANVDWQADFFSAIRPSDPAGFPSIGARGCFLSHLSVLRQARDEGADILLVMEDDLSFRKGFREYWNRIELKLLSTSKPWSIIYLGHSLTLSDQGLVELKSDHIVRCSHFMVFARYALPVIIAQLEEMLSRPPGDPSGGPMHVDGAYSTIRASFPQLSTFAHAPSLGFQRPSRTDIGPTKFFDSIGFLRPVISSARTLKGRLMTRS